MEKETFIEQNVHEIEMPPVIEFAALILTMLFCLLLVSGLKEVAGIDLAMISEMNSGSDQRNILRTLLLVSNALSFILPALLFSYFMYRKNWLSRLKRK